MYNLVFTDYNGDGWLVAKLNSPDDAFKAITKDVKARKFVLAGIQNFKIPYVRWWGDVETTGITYDVGSHTEFYHLYKE